ncbi:MFS transporter [Thermoplasma volcanium]|nr:MFS transporter [Thermoplasma volcanium]
MLFDYSFRDYDEVRKFLDTAEWNRIHTSMALTMIASFFVWGLLLVTAPLVTEWPIVPSWGYMYVLLSSPAGLLIGNVVLGRTSDLLGRKSLFMATLALGIAGILGIIFSRNFFEILASIFIAEFGFGGEETVSLAFLAEQFPLKYRGKVLVLVSNSANVGVAAISGIFIAFGYSIAIEKLIFGVMAIGGITIALYTRSRIPESLRWFYTKNSDTLIEKPQMHVIPFIVLSMFAITIVLTFALVADILGPYEYPKYTSIIPFIYGLGEAISGFAIIAFIDRIGRRLTSVIAYMGGFLSMAVFLLYLISSLPFFVFLVLLVINSFFGELGWAVREILQPELFTTIRRGSGIAAVRGIAYALYIVSIFVLNGISVFEYMVFATIIWVIGSIGSILWYSKGYETLNKSLI